MRKSMVYYAVKSYIAIGEHLEAIMLCKKSTNKCYFAYFFTRDRINKIAHISFL